MSCAAAVGILDYRWVIVACAVSASACSPRADERSPSTPSRVVVADFTNATGEPLFDRALKHALALVLDRSPLLEVVPGPRVADSRAMNRSPDERVTADLGWEVAARESADILVLGSIAPHAQLYVISVDIVGRQDGRTLSRVETRAGSRNELLDALVRAADDVREALGDRLALSGPAAPLTHLTTRSLEAFAAYAEGRELADKGRHALAVPHFTHALALDPDLTLARTALADAAKPAAAESRATR